MFDCLWWMLLGECIEKFAWCIQGSVVGTVSRTMKT